MRKLATDDRAAILSALVEGNSMASTCRMLGVNKVTVLRLLADAGTMAQQYQDQTLCNLKSKRIECDEIWAFCYAKKRNVPENLKGVFGYGDVWTWTAIDPDSKLMVNWYVGSRDSDDAHQFMAGLAGRFLEPIHVTTDGLHAYWNAIINNLGNECHSYAQCVKIYKDGYSNDRDAKYSAGECTGVEVLIKFGDPDPDAISTSYVERSNLTMRMGIRRFTRLTNGFSKRVENHQFSVALHYFHYNFIRRHMTIKTTPAVAAGLADRPWTMVEFVRMMEREEDRLGGRISDYKPAASVKAKLDLMRRA